jgi:hypothetical protein
MREPITRPDTGSMVGKMCNTIGSNNDEYRAGKTCDCRFKALGVG